MRTRIALSLIILWLCGAASWSLAEDNQVPIVDRIDIQYEGVKAVSLQAIRSNIQLRPGRPLNQLYIERSIRALDDTGLFDGISVRTQRVGDGKAVVTFIVEPKYRIDTIRFVGKGTKQRWLTNKIESKKDEVLDEWKIKQDRNTLVEHFQKKGYLNTSVEYEILRNPESGQATVIFAIERGARLRIKKIQFSGNDSIPTKELLRQMETKRWNYLSWFSGRGRLQEENLEQDLQRLRDYYQNKGFLDVAIDEEAIEIGPKKKNILVSIPIQEGRIYSLGTVDFTGNTVYSTEELESILGLKPGDVFSPRKQEADEEAITDHYGKEGYLDTRVVSKQKPNLSTGNIDLVYNIKEGEKNYVESVNITGNEKTKGIVILRELALAPGEVFDTVKMRTSEARLRNTRYFDQVNLSPQDTDLHGRKNLNIDVEEARTGNLTFGAGFSSLDKGVVFAELTQGNFDLFNPRSLFQGDGQKFRLRLQLGSSSNQVLLAFEEPWLFEQRLSLGFELFRLQTDFVSSEYDELRTGLEVYLRKRLIGLWTGRVSYRLEDIEIFDMDEDEVPPDILSEKGSRTTSKVGFSLVRDTRNSYLFTSKGNRVNLLTEFAGLGGSTNYLKLEARGAQYLSPFEDDTHVFNIIGRIGTLIEYDDEKPPFFDRYYLGGPNSLRGFEYREVGPKQQAANGNYEPIGGSSFGFFSLEYNYKLVEMLRLACFYDSGFVNSDETDFSTNDYNDNWGLGLRIFVLGSPLRLDYGIPIRTDDHNDNDGSQFYFSFGTRF